MTLVAWRVRARHAEARHEQGPVEPPSVVAHEPAVPRDPRGQLGEERRLVGVVREQELDLAEQAALPPAEPHEEGERSCRRRKAGRLGVQAEQWSVGRRLARQCREPLSIHRQDRRWRLHDDERPPGGPHQRAADCHRESLRSDRRSAARLVARGSRMPGSESALEIR